MYYIFDFIYMIYYLIYYICDFPCDDLKNRAINMIALLFVSHIHRQEGSELKMYKTNTVVLPSQINGRE